MSEGGVGDTVTVQNPVSYRQISATVTGPRRGARQHAVARHHAHPSRQSLKERLMSRHILKVLLASVAVTALAGCSAVTRIKELGDAPTLATMADPASPVTAPTPTVPMLPPAPNQASNSLWISGSRSFFHDSRASRPGDIITVNISVADAAKLSNSTTRARTNSDDANLTNFFGLEGELANALPSGADPANLVKMGSDTSNVGSGAIDRSETINLTLAALVTQVLPQRQHGDRRPPAGAREQRTARSPGLRYRALGRHHQRQHRRSQPDRGGPHLLWRPRAR